MFGIDRYFSVFKNQGRKQLKAATILGALILSSPTLAQDNAEVAYWSSVALSGSIAKLQLYIDKYPNGHYTDLAKLTIEELKKRRKEAPAPQKKSTSFADQVKERRKKQSNGTNNANPPAVQQSVERRVLEVPEIRVEPKKSKESSGFSLSKFFGDREPSAEEKKCDALAGHPEDKSLTVPGTPFSKLKQHASKAVSTCLKAVQHDEPRQYYQLYRSYLALNKPAVAAQYLRRAAEGEFGWAHYWLGVDSLNGYRAQKQNLAKALDHLAFAARQGESGAMIELGLVAYKGKRTKFEQIKANKARAFELFQMAEARGHASAYVFLGDMYKNGDYLKRDLAKARHYYNLSIKQNAFNRKDARKALASLELDEYRGLESYDEIAPVIPNMWAYLDLQEQGVGKSLKQHNELVATLVRHVNWLIDVKSRTMGLIYFNSQAPERQRQQEMFQTNLWLDQVLSRLDRAVTKRNIAFPDRFKWQSLFEVEQKIKQYRSISEKVDEQLATYFRVRDIHDRTKTTDPRNCISERRRWDGRTFKSTFTNNCDESVWINGNIKIRNARTKDNTQWDYYKIELKPGQRHTVELRQKKRKFKVEGTTYYNSCYAVDEIKALGNNRFKCLSGQRAKARIKQASDGLKSLNAYFEKG